MRPILIHKYEKDKAARAKEFFEMFEEDGEQFRKLYRNQKTIMRNNSSNPHSSHAGSERSHLMRAATVLAGNRRKSLRVAS